MYRLSNRELAVEILDPIADQARFGVRYCTGGYIFQVIDSRVGDLLSGPTFPDAFNWFDGQGIPDAFSGGPLRDPAGAGHEALVLGIGVCDLQEKTIVAPCTWTITEEGNALRFVTLHEHAGYVVELTRVVSLRGRTVRSMTTVRNGGKGPIPMRWYPHPFYPQPAGDELLKLNIPVAAPEHEAYVLQENGFMARRSGPWSQGHFLALDHTPNANLVVLQKHPKLGMVAGVCSYAPDFFPVWGNPRTFSWEPYLERTIGAGQAHAWWIDYEF